MSLWIYKCMHVFLGFFVCACTRFWLSSEWLRARLPHIGDEGKNAPETYTAWCWLSIPVRRTGQVMHLSMLCPTIPHPGYSGGKLGNWIINLSNFPVWGLKLWSNPHSFPCYPYGGLGVLDPQQLFPPGSHQAKDMTWKPFTRAMKPLDTKAAFYPNSGFFSLVLI